MNIYDLDQTLIDTYVTINNVRERVSTLSEKGLLLSKISTDDELIYDLNTAKHLSLWSQFILEDKCFIISARANENLVSSWISQYNPNCIVYCVSDSNSKASTLVGKNFNWSKIQSSVKKGIVLRELLKTYSDITFYDDSMENIVEIDFICNNKINCVYVSEGNSYLDGNDIIS